METSKRNEELEALLKSSREARSEKRSNCLSQRTGNRLSTRAMAHDKTVLWKVRYRWSPNRHGLDRERCHPFGKCTRAQRLWTHYTDKSRAVSGVTVFRPRFDSSIVFQRLTVAWERPIRLNIDSYGIRIAQSQRHRVRGRYGVFVVCRWFAQSIQLSNRRCGRIIRLLRSVGCRSITYAALSNG